MARFAAYLGPVAPVSTVVEQGTYSLSALAQSNADGWGIGWYPNDGGQDAVRLISRAPLWTDQHHLALARRFRSHCVVAGVRRAQPGTIPELSGVQPHAHGPFLFFHDGELTHFREVFERPLRERLSDAQHRSLVGLTDSEILFATWVDALAGRTGPDAMADALEQTVALVRQIAMANATPASFAVVVSDGANLVALRTATHGVPPSLHTIVAGKDAPVPAGARIISSEPLFPGAWAAVEVHSLTIFTAEDA